MSWDVDAFVKFCKDVEEKAEYQSVINASLPNTGETPEEICERGFKAYVENVDSLVASLKD